MPDRAFDSRPLGFPVEHAQGVKIVQRLGKGKGPKRDDGVAARRLQRGETETMMSPGDFAIGERKGGGCGFFEHPFRISDREASAQQCSSEKDVQEAEHHPIETVGRVGERVLCSYGVVETGRRLEWYLRGDAAL